jgi:hypothetical protein
MRQALEVVFEDISRTREEFLAIPLSKAKDHLSNLQDLHSQTQL